MNFFSFFALKSLERKGRGEKEANYNIINCCNASSKLLKPFRLFNFNIAFQKQKKKK